MIKLIDNAINRITMYRLVLYYLIFLLGAGIALSAVGILPYDPFALLFMIGFAVAVSAITNAIFARVFNVPANVELVYISALILALIITPLTSLNDLWFIGWASVLAMSSKYIVAVNKKHLFNPVAFAVVVTALTIDQTASWWVATGAMLPFVLIGGLLVVRRIRRFGLVLSFFAAAFGTTTVFTLIGHGDLLSALQFMLILAPTLFFGFIFITEPLTTPPTHRLQIIYGVLVGLLFAPEVHFGGFYFTPELALLVGNLFSFLVSPKTKLILTLKQRLRLSADVYEFVFMPSRQLAFAPGQYMEWTLGHDDPDSRGNRRYFTLASAPTERELRVGVKFYPEPSTYKESLLMMEPDDAIVAGQLAGDFTLPDDRAPAAGFYRRRDWRDALPQHDQVPAGHAPAPPDHAVLLEQERQRHRLSRRLRPRGAKAGHQDGLHHHRRARLSGVMAWQRRARRCGDDPLAGAGLPPCAVLRVGTGCDGRRHARPAPADRHPQRSHQDGLFLRLGVEADPTPCPSLSEERGSIARSVQPSRLCSRF